MLCCAGINSAATPLRQRQAIIGIFLPTLSESQPEGKVDIAVPIAATVSSIPILSSGKPRLRDAYSGTRVPRTPVLRKNSARTAQFTSMNERFDSRPKMSFRRIPDRATCEESVISFRGIVAIKPARPNAA